MTMRGYTHHQQIRGDDSDVCKIQITYDNDKNSKISIELPLDDRQFASLQDQDLKIQELLNKVQTGIYSEFYIVKNNVLFKHIIDNSHKFEARVFPKAFSFVHLKIMTFRGNSNTFYLFLYGIVIKTTYFPCTINICI